MYSVFPSSYTNTRESLGELKKTVWLVFPQHFSFSQTSTRVCITRQKHGTCFLFLKQRAERLWDFVVGIVDSFSGRIFEEGTCACTVRDEISVLKCNFTLVNNHTYLLKMFLGLGECMNLRSPKSCYVNWIVYRHELLFRQLMWFKMCMCTYM